MPTPQPDEHHLRLHRLAGHWVGKETMHPSEWQPNGGVADGVTTSRVALGGFTVVTDYTQSLDGQTTYEGHGVYTVDSTTKDVVLYWFDSFSGSCEEFRGGWDGDVLTLFSESPMMGHMRMTSDFGKPGVLRASMACSRDRETWQGMFDCDYARQDAS
ncbi:MAG: DUF1579 domain-containing protein [bacterium]|nr:DUF1579 domain-containing protein [bacterium]